MKAMLLSLYAMIIAAGMIPQAFCANDSDEINDNDNNAVSVGADASTITARITIQTSQNSNNQPIVVSVNVPRIKYDDVGPELVSLKLSNKGIDVHKATIEVDDDGDDVHTTCFFWRDELKKRRSTGSARWSGGNSFVSYPFSSSYSVPEGQEPFIFDRPSVLETAMSSAEFLYCYDSSTEHADKSHVTVLLENARGQMELLRIPSTASDANISGKKNDPVSVPTAIHWYSRHPELSVNIAHAALLYDPDPISYCTLYPEEGVDAYGTDQRIKGTGYLFDFLNPLRISPVDTIARIECHY